MPINVSEAIDSDTSEIITVERKLEGVYTNGIYQEGSSVTFKSLCSVQQPTPDELQMLESGERNKDILKFISNKQIKTTSDRDRLQADVVIRKGKRYKIISAGDWNSYGHTSAYGAREE